jgi:type I restriction enzyme S subunit
MIADLKPYPEYKKSGSRWLGAVPAAWEVHNLRTLISKRVDRNRPDLPLLSVAREKGVFVRSLTDAKENHNVIPEDLSNYKVARAGDLVINKMKAWQGSMGIAPCDGIVSPAYFVFDFRFTNRAFGQKLLRSKPYVAHFGQASDGVRVGQWDLSIAGMRQIPVLVPPPSEQAAIVRFLDWANGRLGRAIRAKKKIIALLGEQKQAIIHRAVTRGLDPSVAFKPSGIPWLGEIPEHWEVIKLKYLSPQVTVGIVIQPARLYVSQGVPALRSLNISSGEITTESLVYISEDGHLANSKSKLREGDVVLVRTGRAGIAVVIPSELDGANCIDLLIVRKSNRLLSEYLLMYLRSNSAKEDIAFNSVGAIQAHYNTGTLANLRIPLPSIDEQRRILATCRDQVVPLEAAISCLEREIELLREYRARLVSDVVTGKLDVREAAGQLPEEAPLDSAEGEADLGDESEAGNEEAAV